MDELKIYDRTGAVKLTAYVEEDSTHDWGIMEDNRLSLTFHAEECVLLLPGDWVVFDGERFWLTQEYKPQQSSETEWKYDLSFGGVEALLAQTLVLDTTDGADRPLFVLTAPAREHMTLIVANINRRLATTEWKVGEVVPSENIEIDYSGKSCAEALAELAETCRTEYWADGITLNLSRCEFGEAIELGYGRGLTAEIECSMADDLRSYAYLYPVGSTRNIDPQKYGHDRLQLPGGETRIDMNPEQGFGELVESEAFEDIYPRYVGQVYSVLRTEAKDDEGNTYYIYRFDDRSLPFNPNDYEIAGLVKRVTFQTGELAGREFEVNYDPDWDEGMFEIITQWPYDDDTQLPGGLLEPEPGDEYVLWNIRMPDEYYPLAEQEFLQAAQKFAAEARRDVSVYKAPLDYIDVQERGLVLRPGQRVRLLSKEYFPQTGYYDSRIIRVSRPVLYPDEVSVEISAVRSTGFVSRIENDIKAIRHSVKLVSSEYPDLIRSWEETPASDTTVYTSRKSEREFLNRRRGGTVEGDLFLRKGAVFGDFASGLTGFGGLIDGAGNAELQNITVRESLTVPSLNYNRVDISVGDDWSAPGGGIVAEADPTGQLVTLKLEEGEIGAVKAGDICMGIFHSPIASENAPEDKDDGRGNRTFAGFATSYFRITEVLGDRNERFRYELRPVSERYPRQISPMAAMKFVAYGSFTDAARRTSRYSTRTYQRYLRNVSDWEFTGENIAAQFGDLSNLALFGLQMSGYSAYLDNIYLQGLMRSLDGTFVIDTKTKSLLLASSESGMGIAYNPEQGFVQGKIYDPATGRFQKEFDLDAIEQTASNAEQTAAASQQAADSASRKAQEAKDYIDNTLPGEFARINEKLDGVVENWFYAYTPTLQNDPAASWLRDGEQAQHEGDTFTNTQPYVDAQTTPDAGKSWRWVKSGEAYEWTPIADSDAVKALREAAKAQETADGKSRTFVVQPAPPYDVGDLWMQGPSGDVMRCIKSRQTGAFDASDWDKASKYTDDTLARDAKQTARTAQETADKAKASAEAATDKLATWASDSYISPQEKTALRQQQKDIQSEHAEITAQASKYSVPATDYTAAYNAANAALAKYTASTPESIAVGADYANIAAYYTARETILDAIAAAAKAYSERLVSEVQPVGENLLRHTKDFTKGWTGKGESVAETYNGLTVYYGKSTVDYKEIRQQEVSLLPSTEYTLSFWAKGVGQVISYCWPYVNEEIIATNGTAAGYTGRDTYCPYDLTTEWKRYWVTFRTYSEAKGGNVLFRVMVGNEAYVCGAKLAQGNKGIVWTASPEDAEYSGVNIIDNTESRTIGAGDNDYAQTGFAVGAVAVGDQFALSVGSIDLLAGTATGFTAQLYDYSANVALADAATLTADSRTAVYTVTRAADKAHLILYAGRWGSTAGNTVRYEKVMLVRGNKPEPSWSPSTADRQAEIDNLRPASVNILPDSAALTTDANGGPWARNGAGPVNETYEGYSSLVLRGLSGIGKGVYIVSSDLETESGTEYVVSVWVHASKSVSIALGWEKAANVRTTLPAEAAGKWYRLSAVQNRPAGSSFVCYADVGTDDTVAFRNIMCSAGNMLTEWSPSVEDVQKQIDQAKIAADNLEYLKKAFENDDTIEYGGLYLASFLGVKNSAKAVVAGITGKNFLTGQDFAPDDRSCPMIFAGAASAADANSAKFRVYPNGATYAEEAYIKGTITATAGSFGDFKIDGLYLISSHDTTHGIKIGDGMVYSWNEDGYAKMHATGVSLGEIMPTYQGFTSAAAQFVAKVNEEIPYEASVAYYAYMRNTYGKKAYAFLANAGDIETIHGAIQGHIHYRTMSITGTGHMIGGARAGKEQMFVMKNTARASIYLPPSGSARIGEIYYVVQCSTSGTYILPYNGSSDKIKDSDGTIITRHILSANQSCSVMWDGAYWRILPF
ncbi:hypothetical protein [Alistipes sp.]|uniref:hypothetical protein n=1 Tax=Alistipes sp. TaxID=1872444 RepID=UPI0025BB2C53|nr:hypothetical protein [Alistipes sp.]